MLNYCTSRTFLVTGSSSGIGRAIGDTLYKSGNRVIYHSKINHNINIPDNCFYFTGDLSKENEVDQLANMIPYQLDGIVCCAGRTHLSVDTPLNFNKNDYLKVFDNILLTTILVCNRFIPDMIRRNKGKVVIIGGDVVDKPNTNGGMCCYAMAKAAVQQYAIYLAAKTRQYNINVNVVSPTGIDKDDMFPTDKLDRSGKRQEVAWLVDFLCCDRSSFISGQIIRLNGGKLSY